MKNSLNSSKGLEAIIITPRAIKNEVLDLLVSLEILLNLEEVAEDTLQK